MRSLPVSAKMRSAEVARTIGDLRCPSKLLTSSATKKRVSALLEQADSAKVGSDKAFLDYPCTWWTEKSAAPPAFEFPTCSLLFAKVAAMMLRIVALLILLVCVPALDLEAANPAGRWSGSWSSSSTGHKGPLRAKIRQVDSNTYRALFVGRFAKVIPFAYPAKLERVPGTCNTYRSSTRLPLLGEYRMTANVSANRFQATFRGKKDAGVFQMSR